MAVTTFLDDNNNSRDTNTIFRIEFALVATAIAIQSEAATVPSHSARSTFALKVLANPSGYAQLMAPGFTVQGSIVPTSTDQNLLDRASAIWNAYAVQG